MSGCETEINLLMFDIVSDSLLLIITCTVSSNHCYCLQLFVAHDVCIFSAACFIYRVMRKKGDERQFAHFAGQKRLKSQIQI